ncbi:MAG: hypothetical protein DME52_13590 [Verrucomicrobia bacterium]|nr:MAG: hypothetical protein DME52_13590 [Verrucomicrobiota bacterium]
MVMLGGIELSVGEADKLILRFGKQIFRSGLGPQSCLSGDCSAIFKAFSVFPGLLQAQSDCAESKGGL